MTEAEGIQVGARRWTFLLTRKLGLSSTITCPFTIFEAATNVSCFGKPLKPTQPSTPPINCGFRLSFAINVPALHPCSRGHTWLGLVSVPESVLANCRRSSNSHSIPCSPSANFYSVTTNSLSISPAPLSIHTRYHQQHYTRRLVPSHQSKQSSTSNGARN